MALGGDIALIDIFKMLTVTAVAVAILFPKKKEYEYTSLDEKGVLLNIVLSIIYVPMSFAGICTVFFQMIYQHFHRYRKIECMMR